MYLRTLSFGPYGKLTAPVLVVVLSVIRSCYLPELLLLVLCCGSNRWERGQKGEFPDCHQQFCRFFNCHTSCHLLVYLPWFSPPPYSWSPFCSIIATVTEVDGLIEGFSQPILDLKVSKRTLVLCISTTRCIFVDPSFASWYSVPGHLVDFPTNPGLLCIGQLASFDTCYNPVIACALLVQICQLL